MQESIEKAKLDGVIKSVKDIKLSNKTKKLVKEGIVFNTFDSPEESSTFAVVNEKISLARASLQRGKCQVTISILH